APNTPASWWIQTPFIFIHSPLRAEPLLGSKVKVRKPVLTSDASICSFPCRTRVLNVYSCGVSKLHGCGFLTFNVVLTSLFAPAARLVFVVFFATTWPWGSRSSVRTDNDTV